MYKTLLWLAIAALHASISPADTQKTLTKYESIPLFLSVYDPELCHPENGGIMTNCDPADPEHMAMGHRVEDWYGRAAACPADLLNKTLVIEGIGRYRCLDTGTAIKPTYREVYTANGFVTGWYLVVDLLYPHEEFPWYAYHTWEDWRVED